ncbi:hypothetical protein P280DRAFT_456763 [Massarina eburnea CBS 473.64]|uniref:Uncharacterized protein n=1 Tax=Massarina eburnea CBS 473.64 TaxID=1395130 RepID=A0A6A6RSH2_9PLEO|nr:hypothetical protein P280DRAFT_456763 [Massarina eburnea CBS 473.64]
MASSSGGRGDRRGKQVCFSFQRQGRCKFGAKCRYSHDIVTGGDYPHRKSQQRADENPEQSRVRNIYREWRHLLRDPSGPHDASTRQKVWNGALGILNDSDRGWKQELPRDLDNQDLFGLRHIQVLMECPSQSDIKFYRASRSFLLVLTHPSLLDTLSVDTYVGSLYNFMSGANGVRAIPFFRHVCETITNISIEASSLIPPEDIEATLIAVSAALAELLARNPRVRFNEELPTLLDTLEKTASTITDDTASITSQSIASRTSRLRATIARAQGLLSSTSLTHPTQGRASVSGSAYPRQIEMPCNRHDNDKEMITDMQIFPTSEEIRSDVADFLPFTDPEQPHYLTEKAERHIDTYFRLLRYDIFGELKAALAGLIDSVTKTPASLNNPNHNLRDVHAYSYANARVSDIGYSTSFGLQIHMSFSQPLPIQKKSSETREKWWKDSKRLQEGVLLSFVWVENSVAQHIFLVVSGNRGGPANDSYSTKGGNVVTIRAKPLSKDELSNQALVNLSLDSNTGILLEYPRILPATFVPILKNLQDMQSLNNLPFSQWIVPDQVEEPTGTPTYLNIAPPLYARGAGFFFSLGSILKDNAPTVLAYPSSTPDDDVLVDDLEARTDLDRGQCRSLLAALTREFAFIQGPPGTGKSYLGVKLMKVLLDAKKKAKLGPIVVVCYTNHALDQFLEHLIDTGINKIIRIGGRSHSVALEDHNLRKISQSQAKTKLEGYQVRNAYESLEKYQRTVNSLTSELRNRQRFSDWKYFEPHLQHRYAAIAIQFNDTDEEGYTVAGRPPFEVWREETASARGLSTVAPDMSNLETLLRKAEVDVYSLSASERYTLICLWTQELLQVPKDELFEAIYEAEKTQSTLKMIYDEVDRRVLEDADVIGLTTTGLAKNITTLKHVRSKVIICEEAGEVVEPHMLSVLLPSVEHFIQIGDHEQLRPCINNFRELSLETNQGRLHALDRSQFERLSVGDPGRPLVPVAQLNVQRRMRPAISKLIRETLYDKLVDHPSTTQLPDVVGMRKNVFWFDHNNSEDGNPSEVHHQKSKANTWEVAMVQAFVRHMVRQGVYASSDIAVLTPYTGQLQKLRTAMQNDFEIILSERDQDALAHDGLADAETSITNEANFHQQNTRRPLMRKRLSDLLRIATVDNFQGEEAKIIIVSLVRSNKDRKVGFLKTTNRINVLLSRAQHGMYLIGNANTYSNVPMWEKVIEMLRATDAINASLGLCCPRHPEKTLEVQSPEDFARLSPEGGCREACTDRLPDCGHRCQSKCHSVAMHDVWKCERPCERRHPVCQHACQKPTCGEDCGLCMVILDSVRLPCGHRKKNVHCYWTQDINSIQCDAVTEKVVRNCNHVVKVKCSQDVNTEHFRCPTSCGAHLACGHTCPGTCGRCKARDINRGNIVRHVSCNKVCGRPFGTCSHVCRRTCHSGSDCGLCHNACEVQCKHSRCKLECHQACAPCVEPCTWSCEHQSDCTMPCAAPCNRLPCDKRCTKLLSCGHQCPSLCGEGCPQGYCQACGMKADVRVDMLEFKEYREIDLDNTPIVVLGCGHFFTSETLDGLIEINGVYEKDGRTGEITGLKKMLTRLATKIPACPDCQTPIRQYATQRYNRLINRAVIDQMTQRFITTSQGELHKVNERLVTIETSLDTSFASAIPPPPSWLSTETAVRVSAPLSDTLRKRYKDFAHLFKEIRTCIGRTQERHQPTYKLHEATIFAMRKEKNATLSSALTAFSLDETTPSPSGCKVTSSAEVLLHKVSCVLLEDKFRILNALKANYSDHATVVSAVKFPGNPPHPQAQTFLRVCNESIKKYNNEKLPKLAVETVLYHGRIVRAYQTSSPIVANSTHNAKAAAYVEQSKKLLEQAQELCRKSFQHADSLLVAVNESLKLLKKEWHEDVTADELAAIKQAMVSGRGGIATHSGHWYYCANGHPFAIGECGMPMEEATCPECGARIGGGDHQVVEGVTRAMEMEH